MVSLDFRTVFTGHLLSTALCAVVLTSLWLKNRERSDGLGFWVANIALQLAASLLILLRGFVPDLLSMAVASTLVVGGIVLLLMGLERYLDVPGKHYHNYAYLVVFFAVHAYFSVVQPNLLARNVNSSVGIGFLSLQIVWLLVRRVSADARADVRMTSAIFGAYAFLSGARIAVDLLVPAGEDLFHSGLWDTLVILGYQMLQIGLTLSLVLLVTRILRTALESDIAQRIQAENALRLSEQKFSAAFENIPDALVLTSLADGLIIDVNHGFTRISEYTQAEAVGKTTRDLQLWAEASDRSHLVDVLQKTGEAVGFEAVFRSKSGRLVEAVVSAAKIVIGEEQFILTVIHDATASKLAQAAVARSEAKFATAFHTSPDAVNINRLEDGVYLDVNEGFTKLTGYTAAEVVGVSSVDIHIWDNPADRERLVAGLVADGVVNNLEASFKGKDGSVIVALMSARIIEIDGEQYILSVTRDIADRLAAEEEILRLNDDLERRVRERTGELTTANEELLEANTRLDEATRAKSDFLASMSHELRTPLNSIIGFSDILIRGMAGELEPEQQKQIGMINASGKYLLELINEVLDLSAIEAGRMHIESVVFDVPALVTAVAESLAPLAAEKGLTLGVEISPAVAMLVSDRVRLEQVLYNLLGNAIKFTDAGSVRVDVRRSTDEMVFSFTDTGRGISQRDLTHIFDEFYQVKRHDIGKSKGTGLGLTVSKRLVELLGGSIDVESVHGAGSTFTVRLPAPG